MSCQHPNDHPDLPCPWPDCPQGTPQQAVALLEGEEGVVRGKHAHSLAIESDGGVELWRRRRSGSGWEWERQQA